MKDDALKLLDELSKKIRGKYKITLGLSLDQVNELDHHFNFALTQELKEWLQRVNGGAVGPGGIYGVWRNGDPYDVDTLYKLHPKWRELKWFPVGSDGCGNYYVLDCNLKSNLYRTVGFVDAHNDSDKIVFIVASNLWVFLRFYFMEDMGETRWPFDKDYVVGLDSGIMMFTPLPWEV